MEKIFFIAGVFSPWGERAVCGNDGKIIFAKKIVPSVD